MSLPQLDATLADLEALNRFVTPRALRHWQLSVAQYGRFTCRCPVTGRAESPIGHYLVPGCGVIYRFGEAHPFALVAASIKRGFPLLCLISPGAIHWAEAPQRQDLAQLAQDHLLGPLPKQLDPEQPPLIHLGHPNFAHGLWNEYPALTALMSQEHRATFALGPDPLALLDRLCRDAGRTPQVLTASGTRLGWSSRPLGLLGSTRCSEAARRHALGLLDLPTQPGRGEGIWITLRDKGRTPENQVSFLATTIHALAQAYPGVRFFLDGFSTPMDFERPLYDLLRDAFRARIEGGRRLAAQVCAQLPGLPIEDLTGAPLRTALGKLARCHFYLSHAGSMQHKCAWLSGIPGMIHGNRAALRPAALRWNAAQMGGSLAPVGLSPDLVADRDVHGLPRENERNRDYLITDVSRAAAEVVAAYAAVRNAAIRTSTPAA